MNLTSDFSIEYLNTVIWGTLDTSQSIVPQMPNDVPKISVLSTDWRKNKCDKFGLVYESSMKQPENLVGRRISDYQPWETESIKGDGNCFFRCLSKILTGNENSHIQLCSIIAKFIASEGNTKLAWYFRQKDTHPSKYLTEESLISANGIWASDVEIMAASLILEAGIFVATNDYMLEGSLGRKIVRWSLLRACPNPQAALYITNYGCHFLPITSMINSCTPTFGASSNHVTVVE